MKLLQVLSQLDSSTHSRLKKYFSSPYFGIDPIQSTLINILINAISEKKNISKEKIWSDLSLKNPYSDEGLRLILTKTLSNLINFFSIEELKKNKTSIYKNAIDHLTDKNITILHNRLTKSIEKELKNEKVLSGKELYNIFSSLRRVVDVKDNFERKKKLTEEAEFKENLLKINSLLDSFYFIEKIRISLILNNLTFITEEQLTNFNNTILEQLYDQGFVSNNVLAQTYNQTYKLVNSNSKFQIVQDEIFDVLELISKKHSVEAFEIYDTLYNYYVRLGNQGFDVQSDLFALFQFGLSTRLLLKKDQIDPTDFRNIVLISCRMEEYEWALNFIEDHKILLSEDYRQSAYSFSKARIFNNMGNHEGVVDVLRNVEYEDITYNLNSRLLLIAAFYELDEYDILESTIKALKVFLRRKRNVSVKRKANFRDFCDVVYNLMKAGDRKDPSRITKATEIMDTNKGIPSSWWLKEKIAEVSQVLGIKPEEAQGQDHSS